MNYNWYVCSVTKKHNICCKCVMSASDNVFKYRKDEEASVDPFLSLGIFVLELLLFLSLLGLFCDNSFGLGFLGVP